jgi:hypothetical protein
MEIDLPIFQDLSLKIADKPDERTAYPTSRLQKGLVMIYRGQDLAEEAVGFGLPVFKRGLQTVFPGNVELVFLHSDTVLVVTATYKMNLVEKIVRPGTATIKSKAFYAAKNFMAAVIRRFPPIRGPLTALSSGFRTLFGWETTYEEAGGSGKVKMVYAFDKQSGILMVEADLSFLSPDAATEIIIMNEQGAHIFDQYRDSSGTRLSGKEIGCWDEVAAGEASFASSTHGIAFTLNRVAGTRLLRGRELIDSRLAWSGFGYSFPPVAGKFSYRVRIEKIP